jgi:hypothetical protein
MIYFHENATTNHIIFNHLKLLAEHCNINILAVEYPGYDGMSFNG